MTAIECIGRNLMRGVDILPGMYGVGLISMMCNKQSKRLGDYIAGTIVVHDKAIETVAPTWGNRTEGATRQPEFGKLSPDDLVLIETYLNRRYEIEPFIRSTTAVQIVVMIVQKTGVPKPAGQSDDDFLEAIARQLRDGAVFR